MRVIIVGAGIIGITSAWYLTKAGYDVTVIDQHSGPSQEASFANGGMLSVGHSGPNAKPGIISMALQNLFKKDAFMHFKPDFSLRQTRWLLKFLSEATAKKALTNQTRMINLSRFSRECRQEITAETNIEYELREGGIMQICQTEAQMEAVQGQSKMLAGFNIESKVLNRDELFAIEPGLKNSNNSIMGGIQLSEEKTGDSEIFARHLAQKLQEMGVVFDYNVTVEAIHHNQGKVDAIVANGKTYKADHFVIAAGETTHNLMKGIAYVPVYPVKGFSLTLAVTDDHKAPQFSVFDTANQIAITRFDNRVRIAGYAGVEGLNRKIDQNQVKILTNSFNDWFPESTDLSNVSPWAGFRPMMPDGTPLISATPLDNLFINTGHGTYGWTMSCGSAKLLSEIIQGKSTSLNRDDYSLNRY